MIEVRDAAGHTTARVRAGRPCRATVEGIELQVGGRPLVAQYGSTRWTGEDGANGTTLRENDKPVARIHAKQIFDAEGIPVLRVMDNGDVVDPTSRVIRKAVPSGRTVRIGEITVTGLPGDANDVALAALLASPELTPALRALVACHYLLP